MKTIYINSNNKSLLVEAFNKINANDEINSCFVLMAGENHYKKEILEPLLRSSSKTLIGGIFPQIIYNGDKKTEGLILMPSSKNIKTSLINLDNSTEENLEILQNKYESSEISGTVITFVHGFGTKTIFLDSVFNYFGNNVHYFGGGSGTLDDVKIPSIINNDGIHENSGIIGLTNVKLDIGVAHGWYVISEALKVTKSKSNKIINLNWEPAFEVYKRIVEEHSGKTFNASNYSEISKSYPIGLAKIDSEMLIRDPLALEGNVLVTIEEIEEGEYINIMHGNKELLLKGAKVARNKVFKEDEDEHAFCVDCITRVSYLEEDFQKEIEIINKNGNIDGILSLGEIGNTGESFLESYNKTIIVAKW